MAWTVRIGPRDEADTSVPCREVSVRTRREAVAMVEKLTNAKTLAYATKDEYEG